jgi:hypothetical protein
MEDRNYRCGLPLNCAPVSAQPQVRARLMKGAYA